MGGLRKTTAAIKVRLSEYSKHKKISPCFMGTLHRSDAARHSGRNSRIGFSACVGKAALKLFKRTISCLLSLLLDYRKCSLLFQDFGCGCLLCENPGQIAAKSTTVDISVRLSFHLLNKNINKGIN